jgi:hypothetical protein
MANHPNRSRAASFRLNDQWVGRGRALRAIYRTHPAWRLHLALAEIRMSLRRAEAWEQREAAIAAVHCGVIRRELQRRAGQ